MVAVTLALSLAACSSDSSGDNSDGSQDESSSADTIKIGWYGPLSGSAASVGVSGETAVKLAVKQINEKGGVLGKQVELVEYDDQGNTEVSVKNVTRLIEQDQVAVSYTHLDVYKRQSCICLLGLADKRQRLPQKGHTNGEYGRRRRASDTPPGRR